MTDRLDRASTDCKALPAAHHQNSVVGANVTAFATVHLHILGLKVLYSHFQSKPLMNLYIFAIFNSCMNVINLIDSCQAHLSIQYALNIEFIRQ